MSRSDPAAWLFPRTRGGIRWGLERTEALLAGVGDPHRRFRAVHVGGTNGKSSVASVVAAVIAESGIRTGLFTSPPLASWRECVRVGGRPAPEAELARAAEMLAPEAERAGASFFEAFTALAFLVFARARVEVAVVEVGMGGAGDATNVLRPEVALLTNVALDHVRELGGTVREIAAAKAGIFKPGVPAATAESDAVVLEELRARARAVGAPLHVVPPTAPSELRWSLSGNRFRLSTGPWGDLDLRSPLVGPVQAVNVALAVRGLELLGDALRPAASDVVRGVGVARVPGRLQVEPRAGATWIFDVAHNPAAVRSLCDTLRGVPLARPLVALVGILADKDSQAMLSVLLSLADRLVLTVPPSAPPGRRWDPRGAVAALPAERTEVCEDFADALARADALAGGGTVLVTGSHHTVGAALGPGAER